MGIHELINSPSGEEAELLNGWLYDKLLDKERHLTEVGLSLLDRLADHIRVSEKQPEVTDLSAPEEKILLRLLSRVGYRRSGKRIFEATWPIRPTVPVEVAAIREIEGRRSIFLWRREDEHYVGHHIPGKYMLWEESDMETVLRVLQDETGLKLRSARMVRHFNTRPSTGWVPDHEINLLYVVEAEGEEFSGEGSGGAFYPLDALPEDILVDHIYLVDCVRGYFMRKGLMERSELRHDGMVVAPEWKWEVISYEHPFQIDFRSTCDNLTQARAVASDVLVKSATSSIVRHAHIFDDQGRQVL